MEVVSAVIREKVLFWDTPHMRVSWDPSYRVQNKDLFVSLDTISECSGNSFSIAGKLVSQLHCCWKELLLMNLMNLCSRELLSLGS